MYKDFAKFYGFSPIPLRIESPNEKGKVESGIKFVKNNFFKGRSFESGADLENQLKEWNKVINKRIHGTTRKAPLRSIYGGREKPLGPSSPRKICNIENLHKKSLS